MRRITPITVIRTVVRLYYFGGLAGSFHNLVHAGERGGLGGLSWVVPFMVDGVAVVGFVMRWEYFSKHTRKVGMGWLVSGGTLSLIGNVYAASNIGLAALGVAFVMFYILGEIFSSPKHVQPATVDADAEKARAAAELVAAAAERKAAGVRKGQQTRRRNARIKAAETRLIEEMVIGK